MAPSLKMALHCGDHGGQDGSSSNPAPFTGIRKETHVGSGETAICYYSDQAFYTDALDQWNALVTREGTYSYQGPLLAADDPSLRSRAKLGIWCYKVVDHLDLDRAPVAMALSCLDRLLAANLIDRRELFLAILTSLCLSLKAHSHGGQRTTTPGMWAVISNGHFTADDIISMERRICQGLRWWLNPPVADSFLNIIVSILTNVQVNGSSLDTRRRATHDEESEGALHHLVQQSRFLCERSVLDSFFIRKSPSSIAYAAVSEMLLLMQFPQDIINWFLSLPLDHDAEETDLCARRIRHVNSLEGYCPAVTFFHCHGASGDGKGGDRAKAPAFVRTMDIGEVSPVTTAVVRPHSLGAVDYKLYNRTRTPRMDHYMAHPN